MSWSLYLSALVLGALIRASLFTLLGSRVAELGIREAWLAFLILVVFFLPLLHPRFRSWVADRLRASSDAPT
jgi:membrane protein DedA with SNARE-associated domain